ncbi:hypothetical protein Hdeb2414_s0023g00624241 [Helianthus debilis subsp. tardiflorus]
MCGCSSSNDESTELQTSEDGMFYCSCVKLRFLSTASIVEFVTNVSIDLIIIVGG